MDLRKLSRRVAVLAGAAVLAPMLLAGCAGVGVATQSDLDPIRSDINVLEKQFVEVQRAAMDAKYRGQGAQPESGTDAATSRMENRLAELERRLGALEARMGELKKAQGFTAPQPMAPEPVIIEPIEEAPRPVN